MPLSDDRPQRGSRTVSLPWGHPVTFWAVTMHAAWERIAPRRQPAPACRCSCSWPVAWRRFCPSKNG